MSEDDKTLAGRIVLRPVIFPDDEPFLMKAYFSALLEDARLWGLDEKGTETLLNLQYTAQKRQYEWQFSNADHYIILFDSDPVGRYLLARSEDEMRGVDLSILPEYRNLGIATIVLRQSFAEAAQTRRPFTFHVSKNNRARRLYERLGCRVVGENVSHFKMEWRHSAGLE